MCGKAIASASQCGGEHTALYVGLQDLFCKECGEHAVLYVDLYDLCCRTCRRILPVQRQQDR